MHYVIEGPHKDRSTIVCVGGRGGGGAFWIGGKSVTDEEKEETMQQCF